MTLAFWFWVVGALLYVVADGDWPFRNISELGKWAFIVGLAAWFMGR